MALKKLTNKQKLNRYRVAKNAKSDGLVGRNLHRGWY